MSASAAFEVLPTTSRSSSARRGPRNKAINRVAVGPEGRRHLVVSAGRHGVVQLGQDELLFEGDLTFYSLWWVLLGGGEAPRRATACRRPPRHCSAVSSPMMGVRVLAHNRFRARLC